MVFLELEDEDEVELPVLYERLPEFCFCCGLIEHQFKECEAYKGQSKEKFLYGTYIKALSKAEKTKLNRGREIWNGRFEQTTNGHTDSENHRRNRASQTGRDQDENGSRPNQSNPGENEGQTTKTREQLMLMTLEPREQQVYSQKQPSRKTVENIDVRAKVHGNNQEKAGTEDWEGTNGNLALDLEPNQVSNTSQSQD